MIEPLLPKGGRGPKRMDDRRVLNGIFYILRTGAPWRDLPERYGPRTTIYNRYARWARRGIWKAIFDGLAEHSGDSLFFIDSSIVKAHRAAVGAKGGNWRRRSAAHAAAAQARFTPESMNTVVPGALSSPAVRFMTVKSCRTFSKAPERRLPSSPTRLPAHAPSASSLTMTGLWRSFHQRATPKSPSPMTSVFTKCATSSSASSAP